MIASFLSTLLAVLFVIVCLLLIGVILLQKGRGGGLGAALGGGAGSSAFGTKTGDVMTWVTIVLVGLFLLLAMGTVVAMRTAPGKVLPPEVVVPDEQGDAKQYTSGVVEVGKDTPVILHSPTRDVTIYFTTDGSSPTENDSHVPAGGRIIVQPGQELRAMGTRSGWDDSEVTTVQFVSPKEAPPSLPDANSPADANTPVDANS